MGADRMSLRTVARHCAMAASAPVLRALAGKPPKKISAMLRVKNEIEFIERSMLSIINLVDEMVVVDNLSSDGSAEVIAALATQYPAKVKAYRYPHLVARYGEEMQALARTPGGRKSPAFLPNFYNWCLAKCTSPYILKWDGDTVATRALAPALEKFRHSDKQVLWHTGINLHQDRRSYIAGRPLEDMEPRLYFRKFANYNNALGYCEFLWSPYAFHYDEFIEREPEPLYFHMKFCKGDRFSNMSKDLQAREAAVASRGNPLPDYLVEQVSELGL